MPAAADKSARPGLGAGSWRKDQGAENRLYNRYEPLYSLEKKHPLRSTHSFGQKTKGPPEGEAAIEHNLTRTARGHHENKLEKFIQRMGNLIHKNK